MLILPGFRVRRRPATYAPGTPPAPTGRRRCPRRPGRARRSGVGPGQRADHPAHVEAGRGEQAAVGEQAARVEAVVRQLAADQHPAVRQVPRRAGHRLHPARVGQLGVHLRLPGPRVDRQHQPVLLHPAQHGDQRAAAVRPAHVHHVRIGLPVPVHVDPALVQVEQVQAGRPGRTGGQDLVSVRRPPPAPLAGRTGPRPGRARPTRSARRARATRCPARRPAAGRRRRRRPAPRPSRRWWSRSRCAARSDRAGIVHRLVGRHLGDATVDQIGAEQSAVTRECRRRQSRSTAYAQSDLRRS